MGTHLSEGEFLCGGISVGAHLSEETYVGTHLSEGVCSCGAVWGGSMWGPIHLKRPMWGPIYLKVYVCVGGFLWGPIPSPALYGRRFRVVGLRFGLVPTT